MSNEEPTDREVTAAEIENLKRFYPSCTDEELKAMLISLRQQYPSFDTFR